MTGQAPPIGPGAFVAIGGPSGVGKDTLIRYARERLSQDPRFRFVRRTITRPPGDATEDHLSVDEGEFSRLASQGAFALSWTAHGLSYGLPVEIDGLIGEGRVVIANVSRTVLAELQQRYRRVVAVAITADPREVQARLFGRGREDAVAIRQRATRVVTSSSDGWIELRNSGPVAEAGEALVEMLMAAV
jgi:ribose 1,5-bisphosphokinase